MKNTVNTLLLIFMVGLLASCGEMTNRVEEKLNELNNKAEHLDSLVNKEVDKVLTLDSLMNKEGEKIKQLDSLVRKSTSKLIQLPMKKLIL